MSAAGARRPKRPMLWMDFIFLDERGYLPFAQSEGQFLFHLVSQPIVTTNLACPVRVQAV
jgi:DNA replication protein DnaC